MSGGAHDYLGSKVEQGIESVAIATHRLPEGRYKRLRQALDSHVRGLANVLRAIEWADSGDSSPEDAEKELVKFFDGITSSDTIVNSQSWLNLVRCLGQQK